MDVIEEGIKVLNAVGEQHGIAWNFIEHPWNSDYYLEHGMMMPSDALDIMAQSDVIYLGRGGTSGPTGPCNAERAAASNTAHLRPVCLRASQRIVSGHNVAVERSRSLTT